MGLHSITGAIISPHLLDPVFGWLMVLPPWLAIAAISFILSLLITLVYKMVTDQDLMKELKGEMKELQKEMKELREHPEKMMTVQQEFMQTNMKYMGHSMKSTLFTILPVLLIFGWLNANLAYMPLHAGVPFDVTAEFDSGTTGMVSLAPYPEDGIEVLTGAQQEIVKDKAVWSLKGTEDGEYVLEFSMPGNEENQAEVLITEGRSYKKPELKFSGETPLEKVVIGNEKLHPFGDFTLLGWKPGWLAVYIIFAMVFSMSLRKLLKLA